MALTSLPPNLLMCKGNTKNVLTLLWSALAMHNKDNVNNGVYKHLQPCREFQQFPHFCCSSKNFPSPTVWLDFKLSMPWLFILCSRVNLCSGYSVISLPTTGLCWAWASIH